MPADAVLFDCDGLLLDTEPAWRAAERRTLERWGGAGSVDLGDATVGLSVRDVAALLASASGRAGGARAAIERDLLAEWRREVERSPPPQLPGIRDAIAALRGRVPMAVVSSTPEHLLVEVVGRAGIADAFATVTGLRAGERPKPAPDLYLRACRELGVSPGRSHAVEDSAAGAAAARAAGLRVIAVPSVRGAALDADEIVETLDGYDWSALVAQSTTDAY